MKLKYLKALTATALAITIGFSPPIAAAVKDYYIPEAYQQTYLYKAEEYLRDFQGEFNSSGNGQYGLLEKLETITKYALTLYYLDYYKDLLGLGSVKTESDVLYYYAVDFADKCKIFNSSYSKDNDKFTKLKLGVKEDTITDKDKNLKTVLKKLCETTVPEYLGSLLKGIKDESANMDADEIIKTYGVLLSNIYDFMENVTDMCDNLTNISPYKDNMSLNSNVNFSNKIKISAEFDKLRNDYNDLLEVGAQVSSVMGQGMVINVDDTKSFLENLASVTESDGNVTIPEDVEVSMLYLAILAAGSTYTPLESFVGDSVFKAGLKSLITDESAIDAVVNFFDDTKDYRKPLYKRSISTNGQPTGQAELITVQELFQDMVSGEEGALVTVQGKFLYDTKNNYWVYSDTYKTNMDNDEDLLAMATGDGTYEDASGQNLAASGNGQMTVTSDTSTTTSATTSTIEPHLKPTKAEDGGDRLEVWYTVGNVTYVYSAYKNFNYDLAVVEDDGSGNREKTHEETNITIQNLETFEGDWGVPTDARLTTDTETQKTYYQYFKSKQLKSRVPSANGEPVDLETFIARIFSPMQVQAAQVQTGADTENDGSTTTDQGSTTTDPGSSGSTTTDPGSNGSTTTDPDGSGSTTTDPGSSGSTTTDPGSNGSTTTDTDSGESTTTDPTSTTTTSSSSSTVTTQQNQVDDMGTGDAVDASVMADAIVTSEDKMSEPVLLYGAKHSREKDNMTTFLFRNIIRGNVNYTSMYADSNDYVYINAYGDIVTDDNRVILPGCANPLIYADDTPYNPFSVAFMNYYPSILQNTSFFQVASEADINKMMIFDADSDQTVEDNYAVSVITLHDIQTSAPIKIPELETTFYYNTLEEVKVFDYQRLIFGDTSTWKADGNVMWSYTPLVNVAQLSNAGISVFPYVIEDDQNPTDENTTSDTTAYSCAEIIAQNMFHYFTTDSAGSTANQKLLIDNYLVYYFIISNLNGTTNPAAFSSNDTFAYDRYTNDATSRREKQLLTFSQKLLANVSNVREVIGIDDSYSDKLLGPIFAMIKENILAFIVVLVIILLYAFAKVKRDLLQTIVLFAACLAFSYAFVYILPVYVPMFYNGAINDISENLTYEILGVKAEYVDSSQEDVDVVNDDGNYMMNTSSLTLYRVNPWELDDLYNGTGITESDVVGGKTHIVDQGAGFYIEGDSLKVNSDILFNTLLIKGKINEDTLTYHLDSYKTVSNNVDYYTPYYLFVDSFLERLNLLSDIYDIPRTTAKFADGREKNNYLVYSFVNASPFLTPGFYEVDLPEDTTGWSEDDISNFTTKQQAIEKELESTFGEEDQATDWLGLASIFYNLGDAEKQTLWAQTLQDNLFYDEDWKPDSNRIDKLITYINYQTKKFVYSIDDQIGSLSDDVMVKTISLRALVAFTQYASDMRHWLYPYSLNYEELTLGDVLNCEFTNDYRAFIANDMEICTYILNSYGWFSLIAFDVVVVLMYLVVSVVQWLIPLMYLLLGILLLFRFVKSSDLKVPVKGYFKCTAIVMVCSTLMCVGIVAIRRLSGNVIGIYAMLFLMMLITYLLVFVLTALIFNFADFGNTSIDAKVSGLLDKFHGLRPGNITVNSTNVSVDKQHERASRTRRSNSQLNRYSNDRRVDDMYGESMTGGYGQGYGSYNRGYGGYNRGYGGYSQGYGGYSQGYGQGYGSYGGYGRNYNNQFSQTYQNSDYSISGRGVGAPRRTQYTGDDFDEDGSQTMRSSSRRVQYTGDDTDFDD